MEEIQKQLVRPAAGIHPGKMVISLGGIMGLYKHHDIWIVLFTRWPCNQVTGRIFWRETMGNHWFLFFEFQVAAGRVFWDGVIIVTTVFDDYDLPCFTWATRDLA